MSTSITNEARDTNTLETSMNNNNNSKASVTYEKQAIAKKSGGRGRNAKKQSMNSTMMSDSASSDKEK